MRPDHQPIAHQASGDALSLFTHEPESASPVTKGASPVPETPSPVPVPARSAVFVPAPSDVPVPARIAGAVSLDRIVNSAPLRFVEGIAVVQALCAAVKDKGGVNAGMPDLAGIFLRESGDVVAMTPPGAESAAKELARLLHQLVPADSTPPVARLFIDRWTSGTSTDLTAFASEIGYFARPNGRELLSALYARCAATTGTPAQFTAAPVAVPFPVPPVPRREDVTDTKAEEAERPAPKVRWLESHKRHIFAAVAVVALTVGATGLVTWFWPSKIAEAAPATSVANEAPESDESAGDRPLRGATAKPLMNRPASQPRVARPVPRDSATPAAAPSLLRARSEQDSTEPVLLPHSPSNSAPTATLASRVLPDMRIYSAGDTGIEPPKLRSTEILESLIAGFPIKTNSVEVIVDKAGKVERVRMQGPLQRIPDIVLLSRVKEWAFEPATKDGMAVRYRVLLSWDVTP